MDAAIVFAALAGLCWAVNIVIVRWALDRTHAPALVGATVGIAVATAVAAVVALASGQSPPSSDDAWRFALVGAIAPGSSQGLFVASIRSIGPARSSVLVGTAPMFSVMLAIALLDESWQALIVAGTLLTVAGSALISWERGQGFRRIGVALAV
ncbi:MAG: DMT family transporter, partial [Acidimicrobiia bacterium]|nr:DMT family transporter [Acidimicrobiia bacterium]